MAKTEPINIANPAGGSDPKLGDDYIRALAAAVIEILNVDHYVGDATNNAYDEDAAGGHKQITLNAPLAADPTNVANKGFLYTKDVSSVVELFWEDESGNVKQFTSGGKINAVDADGIVLKAGAQTDIAGAKTFTDVVTLADTSALATSGAPAADAQIANKKYVDDQITANATAVAAVAKAWGVVASNGTLAAGSYGITSVVRNSAGKYTITWSTAFSTANYGVFPSPGGNGQGVNTRMQTSVDTKATGSCVINITDVDGGVTDSAFDVVAFGTQ